MKLANAKRHCPTGNVTSEKRVAAKQETTNQ